MMMMMMMIFIIIRFQFMNEMISIEQCAHSYYY